MRAKIFLLLIVGIVFSLVLTSHHVKVNSGIPQVPSACVINSYVDCDAVAKSEYSEVITGVPVAALGLAYYLVFALIVFRGLLAARAAGVGNVGGAQAEGNEAEMFYFLAFLALPPTIFQAAISVVLIQKFCIYCSVLWFVNVVLFLLTAFSVRKSGLIKALVVGARQLMAVLMGGRGVAKVSWLPRGQLVPAAVLAIFALALPSVVSSLVYSEDAGRFVELGGNQDATGDHAGHNHGPNGHGSPGAVDTGKKVELPLVFDGPDKDYFYGHPESRITIVEFGDYQCPMCGNAAQLLHQIEQEFRGKVKVVYKHFPLDKACNSLMKGSMHKFACKAARVARCAGEQYDKGFWEMHEALFEIDSLSESTLKKAVVDLNLDEELLWRCVDDPATAARVKADVDLGIALGIDSTPTIYVNGVKVTNPMSGALYTLVKRLVRENI